MRKAAAAWGLGFWVTCHSAYLAVVQSAYNAYNMSVPTLKLSGTRVTTRLKGLQRPVQSRSMKSARVRLQPDFVADAVELVMVMEMAGNWVFERSP